MKAKLKIVIGDESVSASELLAGRSGLSRSRIKDAMKKGAVLITRKRMGRQRLRRASFLCRRGEVLELFYDPELLARTPPVAVCHADNVSYSLWDKPAGLLSQGTEYGDHCALTRQAELFFKPPRKIHLVHRLDREASGLMILAHDPVAAAFFSQAFKSGEVEKKYQVMVSGNFFARGDCGVIDLPLDGKDALTEYRVLGYDPLLNASLVEARIRTGRLHQIRRHFFSLGFPVLGDPRYGTGNKHPGGLHLRAVSLAFVCPVTGHRVCHERPGLDFVGE